jgi:DNA topoisomerase I
MSETMQAYCVKCKTKRDIANAQATFTATGTPATSGECAVCGTKLFRMGETAAHANLTKPEVVPRKKEAKSKTAAKTSKGKSSKASKSATVMKSTKAKKAKKDSPGRKRNVGKLVIVESPAKARSISGYLGKGYTVIASKGHVRDLLVTQLSVDVENDFEPKYRVPNDKRDTVKEIKDLVRDAQAIYLATDPDREGEAIAWHLMAAAEIPDNSAERVVFHEITKDAVKEAFDHPRHIDMHLVNAQQARRILDRLVGYKITELLWDKVRNRLSAGRVQSIALRMVVDREREINAFVPVEYWTIDAQLSKETNGKNNPSFTARLVKIAGKDFELHSADEVSPHIEILEKSQYLVDSIKIGSRQRKPSPPFTTSTLQQEASRRLGFNARRTMRAAQQLYEGIELASGESVGLISYMRTDSLNVGEQAQREARAFISKTYGDEFMPKTAPQYKTKSKGAQEAHEAIRPTSVFREPAALKNVLSRDQYKLYELIWQRFLASQMENAVYDTIRVEIKAGLNKNDMLYLFRSSGSRIKFLGFLALYEDSRDEDDTSESDEGRIFPEMSENELLRLLNLLPEQHFTQPPPRFTEATLVRALEEYGIGRPSTYAPTVAVIQDRDYVINESKRLVPTDTGKVVSELLVEFFPAEMDYEFTAKMEEQLDSIVEQEGSWTPMLHDFYEPFQERLVHAREEMPIVKQEEKIGRICPTCGTGDLVIKYGRFGKFIGCSNYPECRHTEQYIEYANVTCPKCGEEHHGELVVKKTKRGRTFYGCSRYPDCDYSAWRLPKGAANGSDDDEEEYEDEEEIPFAG